MRCEDWAVACERWEAVRGAFPDHASGYVRGAVGAVERGSAGGGGGVGRGGGWSAFRPTGGLCSAGRGSMRREDWAVALSGGGGARGDSDHASGYVRGAEALLNACWRRRRGWRGGALC